MKNKVTTLLGIEKPVFQGPMSWVSTAPLVAAVSEAGGLGILGTAMAAPEFIRQQMQEVKKNTSKPFAFNTVLHPVLLNDEYLTGILEVAATEKPVAVHFDAGVNIDREHARKVFQKFHKIGVKIIVKVYTMHDAKLVEEEGADILIVKGWEGGGHMTGQATMVLVPEAVDTVKIPVIASGGIADGRGMAAAISLGADGIEMGTVFLAATETAIHDKVKQAVLAAEDNPTVEIGVTVDSPVRQLRNKLSDDVLRAEREHPAKEAKVIVNDLVAGSLRAAMADGDVEGKGSVMAGQVAPLVKEIRPAGTIIDTVIREAQKVLQRNLNFAFH